MASVDEGIDESFETTGKDGNILSSEGSYHEFSDVVESLEVFLRCSSGTTCRREPGRLGVPDTRLSVPGTGPRRTAARIPATGMSVA